MDATTEAADNDVGRSTTFDTVPSASRKPVMCLVCNNTGTQRCVGCSNARYCSKDCQVKEWPLHKLLCKAFMNLEERPAANYRRLFPENESKPRFVWIEQTGKRLYNMNPNAHLGDATLHNTFFDRYRPLHRILGYNIVLWYKDSFLIYGSRINQSLAKSLGPKAAQSWRGPFLAQGFDGVFEEENGKAIDLDTTALAPIVDFLKFKATYHELGYEYNWDLDPDKEDYFMQRARVAGSTLA